MLSDKNIKKNYIFSFKGLLKKGRYLLHPISMLVTCLGALAGLYCIYFIWYLYILDYFKKISQLTPIKLGDNVLSHWQILSQNAPWIFISSGILVILIIVGISIIFTYYQKFNRLYRMHENFINNFTHELKTPLASIQLYLETFKKYSLEREEQLRFIDYMLTDAQRLANNVEQILKVACLENEAEKYARQREDVFGVMETFLQQNAHIFKNGSVTLVKMHPGSFDYEINRSLFEMMLMNLITNAFKYCERSPQVKIILQKGPSKQNKQKNNETIIIKIIDNGIGIGEQEYKKIFKKFYQVNDENSKRMLKGTGLGLYVVSQIVGLHQGKIAVEKSTLQEGTTFTLSLGG